MITNNWAILDLETTVDFDIDGEYTSSPYSPTTRIVSGVVATQDTCEYFKFDKETCQHILNTYDIIVGHNLKFDLTWLKSVGIDVPFDKYYWDTQLFAYLWERGQKKPKGFFSLDSCCEREKIARKKDILKDYLDKGINTDVIPEDELREYTLHDGLITRDLFLKQVKKAEDNPSLYRCFQDVCRTMRTFVDIESYGIHIDINELDKLEQETQIEYEQVEKALLDALPEIMGARPINLNSSADMSKVVYGVEFKDKEAKNFWYDALQLSETNKYRKQSFLKNINKKLYAEIFKRCFTRVYKETASICKYCGGMGRYYKTKKDGERYAKQSVCYECGGLGTCYIKTNELAGIGVAIKPEYSTANGFSTSKEVIDKLDSEHPVLQIYKRYNALSTYLTNFIPALRNSLVGEISHPNFIQIGTRTGRCSSSNPNWFNMPTGKTWPVRRIVTSRFEGGQILKFDARALEFRECGELANCAITAKFVEDGTDIHGMCRDFLAERGDIRDRNGAKRTSFSPIYGGKGQRKSENEWAKYFGEFFSGIGAWHKELLTRGVGGIKEMELPSGRQFIFYKQDSPTKLVNTPVQAWATADLIPLLVYHLHKKMLTKGVKSGIINTVYDDVQLDVHPDEQEDVIALVKQTCKELPNYIQEAWNYELKIPIDFEFKIGYNWLEGREI